MSWLWRAGNVDAGRGSFDGGLDQLPHNWYSAAEKFANSGWVGASLFARLCDMRLLQGQRETPPPGEWRRYRTWPIGSAAGKSNQAISLKDLSSNSSARPSWIAPRPHHTRRIDTVAADTASIMLREKDGDALAIAASYGIPEEIVRNTRVRLGEGLAGMVAQEGKPVVLNSDELDGEAAKRAVRGDIIVSSVIIPILVDTQVRGVLSTAKRRGGTCFDDEDMAALTTLANQASLVIEKMDLLDHLRHQVETLADTVRELRQTRAELLQSEKLANIGQLASGVAHEINNPLQVVLGRTELLVSNLTTGVTKPAPREHTVRIADIVSPCSASRQSSNRVPRDDVNAVLSEDHGPSGAADGGRYRCGDGYA